MATMKRMTLPRPDVAPMTTPGPTRRVPRDADLPRVACYEPYGTRRDAVRSGWDRRAEFERAHYRGVALTHPRPGREGLRGLMPFFIATAIAIVVSILPIVSIDISPAAHAADPAPSSISAPAEVLAAQTASTGDLAETPSR